MDQNAKSTAGKKGGLQILLPFFPEEITMITHYLGVRKEAGTVYYFSGAMPISVPKIEEMKKLSLFFFIIMCILGCTETKERSSDDGPLYFHLTKW